MRTLTHEESFRLWSQLGFLSFHQWSLDLPKTETRRNNSRTRRLQARLKEIVSRRVRASDARSYVEVDFERGLDLFISRIEGALESAEKIRGAGGLGTSRVSLEFEQDLLGPMDDLGYALEFVREMKTTLSKPMQGRLAQLDLVLRDFLPKADSQFTENGDPLFVTRMSHPNSFWWRVLIFRPEQG